ncbi:MAG: hypothetical protein SFU98_18445 [Leptospiraceae bacterium]|nr:hypothetical protein [Leptospiraceae bacterium]
MKYLYTLLLVSVLGILFFTNTDISKKSKKLFSSVFALEASSTDKTKLELPETFPLWKFLTTSKAWKTMEDDFDEQEGSEEEQENEELEEDA